LGDEPAADLGMSVDSFGSIDAVETVRHPSFPHLTHVLLYGSEGLTGLGETFHHAAAVEAYVHAELAPRVVGAPAGNVAELWQRMGAFADGRRPHSGSISVDSSACSALDLAAWDLRARALGLPLHEALGGRVRESIRVYVTAVDPDHLPPRGAQPHERAGDDWGLGGSRESAHRDWTASLERPGELATELVDEGFTALKLFPFVRLGAATRGLSISPEQLAENLAPFVAVRDAVGDRLDLAVDLGSMWTLAPALQIARALSPFELMWLEDPLRISALDAVGRLSEALTMPLAGYDYRCGLPSYIDLIERGRVSLVRMDLGWVGGLTEALRIAAYAEARGLGVILHDCAGPVSWAAAIHAALHLPNAVIQECVRSYARDIYPEIATGVPALSAGAAHPAPGAGHGLALADEYLSEAQRRRSGLGRDGRWLSEEPSSA
jgi:galactonate dehydratase